MVWETDIWEDKLRTPLIPGVPPKVIQIRRALIEEALSWEMGTFTSPNKIYMEPCSDDSLVYFVKPGKEARRKRRDGTPSNDQDMRPVVEVRGSIPKSASFPNIWSDLTRIAFKDPEAFRAVLLLIYRIGFLCDHVQDDSGHWRYCPMGKIKEGISTLEGEVGAETSLGSIEKMLRFVDLLGWQEDVKYRKQNGIGKERIGRINMSLTCIRIPTDTFRFMVDYRKTILAGEEEANYVPLYDIMQLLMVSGTCKPAQGDIPHYLRPYVPDKSKIIDGVMDKKPYTQTTLRA
jgi:hypothetical protein